MDNDKINKNRRVVSDNKGSVGLIVLIIILAAVAACLIFLVVSSMLEDKKTKSILDDDSYLYTSATDTDSFHAAGASVSTNGDTSYEVTVNTPTTEVPQTPDDAEPEEEEIEDDNTGTDAEATPTDMYYPTRYEIVDNSGIDKGYYKDPGRIAHSTDYPYVTVDDSYFEDAVFIGDSRTQGLMLYGDMKTATFYCKQSLFVHNFLSEAYAATPSGTMTVPEALSRYKFKKIYIMIGINSMGLSTQGDFRNYYADIVDTIRGLQPNAVIFVNGIMNVTSAYSNRGGTINNINIRDKNVLISEFANGRDIFYLDMNEALVGEDGGLVPAYTWDGVHLYPKYYQVWKEFLYSHGLQQSTIDYLNS